jgi:hypothetical protein
MKRRWLADLLFSLRALSVIHNLHYATSEACRLGTRVSRYPLVILAALVSVLPQATAAPMPINVLYEVQSKILRSETAGQGGRLGLRSDDRYVRDDKITSY